MGGEWPEAFVNGVKTYTRCKIRQFPLHLGCLRCQWRRFCRCRWCRKGRRWVTQRIRRLQDVQAHNADHDQFYPTRHTRQLSITAQESTCTYQRNIAHATTFHLLLRQPLRSPPVAWMMTQTRTTRGGTKRRGAASSMLVQGCARVRAVRSRGRVVGGDASRRGRSSVLRGCAVHARWPHCDAASVCQAYSFRSLRCVTSSAPECGPSCEI